MLQTGKGRAHLVLKEILALDERLGHTSTLNERLRLLAAHVPGRLAFSTSLGLEDQVLLAAIASSGVNVDVFTLDTGRHFPQTLDTIEASELRYGLQIRIVVPEASDVEALVERDGINGFRLSVEARKACCGVRKVAPLRRGLSAAAGWITGLRRAQSAGRMQVPFAEFDPGFQIVKANPIADWSLDRVQAYIDSNDVPINPLHAQGFPSIGCQPCTRAIRPGEDIRAGRWWWEDEDGKECGLHNRPFATAAAR